MERSIFYHCSECNAPMLEIKCPYCNTLILRCMQCGNTRWPNAEKVGSIDMGDEITAHYKIKKVEL